jgi:hypothetical protein
MEAKEFLKWGLVVLAVLVAWRFVSGWLGGIGGGGDVQQIQPGVPAWAPNYYYGGVYGPIAIPRGNPFYSSPDNPRQWHGRVRPE